MHTYLSFWMKSVIVYSIVCIAVNCYVMIGGRAKAAQLSGNCMFYLNFVWFSSAAYNVWQLIINVPQHVPVAGTSGHQLRVCHVSSAMYNVRLGFMVGDTIIIFILPAVLIFLLYMFTYRATSHKRQPETFFKRHNSLGILLAVVFYTCHLPVHVMSVWIDLTWRLELVPLLILNGLQTLSFTNGLLNLGVYKLTPKPAPSEQAQHLRHVLLRDVREKSFSVDDSSTSFL